MRMRKCKSCGKEFQGSGEQRLCPDCRKQAYVASVMRLRKCVVCGATFPGGPRAKYCTECRKERAKRSAREYAQRKAAGNTRPLGSVDICQVCGGNMSLRVDCKNTVRLALLRPSVKSSSPKSGREQPNTETSLQPEKKS